MIWFHGVRSADACVIVEHRPRRPIPLRKTVRYSVPGRSGDLIRYLDAWENVTLNYDLAVIPGMEDLQTAIDRAVAWLMLEGYQRLEDEADPLVFRLAAYKGGADAENIVHRAGRFTASFDVMPQRFLIEGERTVSFAAAGTLINPTAYPAKPLITLSGSGAGTLTIESRTLTVQNCNGIILDCETQNASGVANANAQVSGKYPELGAGENAISFTGGITDVQIVPRWYVI